MERATIDLWVGVFVAMGFAALLGLAMKVGNLTSANIGDTYQLHAEYENIGGLKARAPVKSAGVVVGRVAEIHFDDKTKEAVVSLDIDQRFHFDKDTIAPIYTSGLLGEQYIALLPGGGEDNLKNGDKIDKVQNALVLEDLIGKFLTSKASEPNEKKAD
jgi:phospholipid/cholesterol/gamma-HCH transport system substrate-binding protein